MTTYAQKTIVATEMDDSFNELGVDIAQDAGATAELAAGTVMGVVTTGGKFAPYDDTNTDGTEVAVGVLLYPVALADLQSADDTKRFGAVATSGKFLIDQLTGYDAAAAVDLGAKVTGNILSF